MFSAIAAIGKNRELGKNGQLLWHLPADLKFFKKTTLGHPVLMGRKTFESLPGMLPGRKHYIVSRSSAFGRDATGPAAYISDLEQFAREHADDTEEIFVIGGGMIYQQMLNHCDNLYLTEIEAEDPEADTFFPDFNKSKYLREELGKGEDNGIKFTFVRYKKIK